MSGRRFAAIHNAYLTPPNPPEPPCGAFSPDGAFTCGRENEHSDIKKPSAQEHVAYGEFQRIWVIADECLVENFHHGVVGEPMDMTGECEERLVIARWPVRPDDFDANGDPTPRGKKAGE